MMTKPRQLLSEETLEIFHYSEMNFGNTHLVPCETAKNLGVVLHSLWSFRSHIDSIVKTCNFHIRNLFMIKDFVNRKNLVTLVHSLIISKVDYCNSLFIGLPNVILKKVQSVLNRAARFIQYSTCPLGFQPPPHLLSCIGCLLRQELNLKYVSLLLKF